MTAVLRLRAISAMTNGWSGVNPSVAAANTETSPDSWFDANKYLGRKGHRYLSLPMKYVLATARQIEGHIVGGAEAGLFLGTASADAEHRRRVMRGLNGDADELPGSVSATGASVHGPAGVLARVYGINGPVITFTGGDDSALICLWQAAIAAKRGKARNCLVGQVEHGDHKSRDGAVIWALDCLAVDGALAEITVESWTRPGSQLFDALSRLIASDQGPLHLITHQDNAQSDLVREIAATRRTGPPIKFLCDAGNARSIPPDMHLFSLLSLSILNKESGRILILSRNGHLFSLSVNMKGNANA